MIIDGVTGKVIQEDAPYRIAHYEAMLRALLDPMSAPFPSDGQPGDMGDRVRAIANMTVSQRVECMVSARDTPPEYLVTLERQHWVEGLGQIGG